MTDEPVVVIDEALVPGELQAVHALGVYIGVEGERFTTLAGKQPAAAAIQIMTVLTGLGFTIGAPEVVAATNNETGSPS